MSATQIVRCAACGTLNRVPSDKLQKGLQPVCGKCGGPLPDAMRPVIVTDANFVEEVERSPLPVLLDVWAPWCGPCRMVAPVVEDLAEEMAGRVRVAKLNVDDNPLTAARYRIQNIPALLVLRDGREIDRIVGARPKTDILRRLLQVLG